MRSLDMCFRRGEDGVQGMFRGGGLATAGLKKLGEVPFQTALHSAKGQNTPPRCVPCLWAHAGVGFVERKYLLAITSRGKMGGGTEAS
jgi:hypothetical protein